MNDIYIVILMLLHKFYLIKYKLKFIKINFEIFIKY
jgi:hypothetical protein